MNTCNVCKSQIKRICKTCRSNKPEITKKCNTHGDTIFYLQKSESRYRCRKCTSEKTTNYRRNIRNKIIDEAGGKCVMCGYNKCIAALHFHHRDPKTKEFSLSMRSVGSYKRAKREAAKCILVCANCHAEIHNPPN
jgi:hypothetical protein